MKCPKCGYLGFERVDRCRNCGYDFSLTLPSTSPELSIRTESDSGNPLQDLPLTDGSRVQSTRSGSDQFVRTAQPPSDDLPLFGSIAPDDEPLITRASPPRTPLAVRRATPDVPRVRPPSQRMPTLDLELPDDPYRRPALETLQQRPQRDESPLLQSAGDKPAGLVTRGAAFVIDLLVLAMVDALVVYFTMQICGLSFAEVGILPKGPLLAFLVAQNAGYLIAFTLGGQTLGKMAVGIRVVSESEDAPLDLGRSVIRTLVWTILAVPAGLGFLSALFSRDHRGLHDRVAGTRVVRTA